MAMKMMAAAGLLALGTLGAVSGASAQAALSEADIQRIRESAPKCEAHPSHTWEGRVSGDTENLIGATIPVSFVGCFSTEAECNTWKDHTSGYITGRIIQFSCAQRGG